MKGSVEALLLRLYSTKVHCQGQILTAKEEDLSFRGIVARLDREESHVTVRVETKRFGKPMTIVQVHGVAKSDPSLAELGRTLRKALATGGTVKDGLIELQGDHRSRLKSELAKLGYPEKKVEIF